jgi:tetratricopeptide (TPR) repeat protein
MDIDPEKEFERGRLLTFRRDFEPGIRHLSNAIENWRDRPDLHKLYYSRGVAYESIGEYDKSINDLTQAIEIHSDMYSFFSRGKAYFGNKDYHAALSDFLTAVKLGPSDYRSLNAAAELLASSPVDSDRNGSLALELAKRACDETSYEDYICLDTLACAYGETGDFQDAVEWELKARDMFVDECEEPASIDFALTLIEYEDKLELFRSGKPFRCARPSGQFGPT